jgi:nicotinate-nucleotide pyrophosphorylase
LVQQGCQVIQLEKLTPAQVARVVTEADSKPGGWRPVIAAAGGINAQNAAD